MRSSAYCFSLSHKYVSFQPRYYDGDREKMLKVLNGCKQTGCTFLVGGRNVDGVFKVYFISEAY